MSSDQTPAGQDGKPEREKSLTHRTVSGFLWSAGGNAAQVVLRMLVLAVLARLIDPASFGIVSAALIAISLLEVMGQVGTSQAIIQRLELNKRDIHTAMSFTVVTSLLMGGLLYLFAPEIAALFGMEGVAPAIQLLALAFPIRGFSVVSEALLQRWMQFHRLAGITLASYVFGYALIALTLAHMGWGVFALIYGQIVQTIILSLCHIFFTRHVFGLGFDWKILRGMLVFSGGVSLSRFANFFAMNADNFIVGRMLGAEALGFYSRAFNFMIMPVGLLGNALDIVLYPAMSSIQNDEERLRRAYLRAVSLIALTVMPLSAVMVVLGQEMILIVLGGNWTEAVVPFQILSACLLFRIGYKANTILARAKGAVYRSAWRQWLFAILVAVGAWGGHFWGISGVASGVGFALAAQFLMMLNFGRSLTLASLGELASIHLRHLTIAVLAGGGTYASATFLRAQDAPHLIVLVAGGISAGVVLLTLAILAPRLYGEEGAWVLGTVAEKLPAAKRFL
ncbi:MAG: lipopolysaccharide biosynthesis protein [Parvibaculum sp.]|nr:lipopolysaccharide biosynthesis protein [Parvibaculum sp.]